MEPEETEQLMQKFVRDIDENLETESIEFKREKLLKLKTYLKQYMLIRKLLLVEKNPDERQKKAVLMKNILLKIHSMYTRMFAEPEKARIRVCLNAVAREEKMLQQKTKILSFFPK